ncbi:MAG: hypothetical protein AAF598_17005, partial [Bacteroidota bacterium]
MTRTPILLQCACFILLGLLGPSAFAQHMDESQKAYKQTMMSAELNKYLEDAYRLALRLSQPEGSFREAPKDIPTHLADQIYLGLTAIYESDAPECIAISRDIRIHSKPFPVTDRLSIILNPGYTWKALEAEMPAGDLVERIQSLDLVVESPFPGGMDREGIVVLSEMPINMAAVGEQLAAFPEVNSVLNTGKERD